MNELNKPLLSICIPTYNRSEYLEKTIESIVSQKDFGDEVEIVVSDNCSTDNTKSVCEKFSQQYNNFHYYRNEINVRDKNFPMVMGKAKGVYRKLCNDTLMFNENSISFLLKLIKDNMEEKPVFFFENKNTTDKVFHNLDEFLKIVSYRITWIGAFGIWEDYCENIENNYEGCAESLWQVPFMINYVENKKNGIVIEYPFGQIQKVEKKNISYGVYKVFYTNYLGFIKAKIGNNQLSNKTYKWLEKDLLLNFFPVWIYNFEKQNKSFEYSKEEDLKKCVYDTYRRKWYFIIFKLKYMKLKFWSPIKAKLRSIKKILTR